MDKKFCRSELKAIAPIKTTNRIKENQKRTKKKKK